MAPPEEDLSSLKCHSFILRPILCKSSIVIFRQQFKTFDPNNFTVFNVLLLKCVAHKKKSFVNFSTFPYVHSFPWSNRITTCNDLFNFYKHSGGNFYRLTLDKENTVALTGNFKGIFHNNLLICLFKTQLLSKLFDQLDNKEIDSYTNGDYASHGEQMLHCWIKTRITRLGTKFSKPNQTVPALHQNN